MHNSKTIGNYQLLIKYKKEDIFQYPFPKGISTNYYYPYDNIESKIFSFIIEYFNIKHQIFFNKTTYSMVFIIGLFVRESVKLIRKRSAEGYIMRWKKKFKKYPNDNDTRVITRFLLFPRYVDDEYRWLELVRIEQFYCGYDYERDMGGYWVDKCWVDQQ